MRLLVSTLLLVTFISCGEIPEEGSTGEIGSTRSLDPEKDILSLSAKENVSELCSALVSKELFLNRNVVGRGTELSFELKKRGCGESRTQTTSFRSRLDTGLELINTPFGAFRDLFAEDNQLIREYCDGSLVGEIKSYQKFGNQAIWLTLTRSSTDGCSGNPNELCVYFETGIKANNSSDEYEIKNIERLRFDMNRSSQSYGFVLTRSLEGTELCSQGSQREFREQSFIGL